MSAEPKAVCTEEEMKGAVDNLLRTVERTPSPSEPNFEFISIDAGDFQALVDLARLASTTPTRSQGEGEAVAYDAAMGRDPTPPDYKAMLAGDMLNAVGDDAAKWADAFCQINPGADWDLMLGWFANAIEHSGDVRRWRQSTQPAEGGDGLLEAAKRLLEACYEDFGVPDDNDEDDEPVGASLERPCAIQFGHMRDLAAAIAKASRPSTDAGGER